MLRYFRWFRQDEYELSKHFLECQAVVELQIDFV